MEMPKARASERGKRPRIFMNGQAAAYSSRCRIGGSVTVSPEKFACQISMVKRRRAGYRKNMNTRRAVRITLYYFAASCAHLESVVRNGLAAGGGSISPFSAALEV